MVDQDASAAKSEATDDQSENAEALASGDQSKSAEALESADDESENAEALASGDQSKNAEALESADDGNGEVEVRAMCYDYFVLFYNVFSGYAYFCEFEDLYGYRKSHASSTLL